VIFKDKNCSKCGNAYTPTGRCSKFCVECGVIHRREKAAADQQAYRIRHGLIQNPGIGSGNAQGRGENHHSFTNGLGCNFQNVRRKIKLDRRYCERCHVDLITATSYKWCIHHKDHDRTNNTESNFELLCKSCHQIEHECHKAFGTCND